MATPVTEAELIQRLNAVTPGRPATELFRALKGIRTNSDLLDVTAGTAAASKALVLGASKEIATITSATITTLTATALRSTAAQFLETQVAQTAKTVSATLTAAELLTGIITVNQGGAAASVLTLPLATAMDTALSTSAANDAFDFSVINVSVVAAEDASIATNTGWTLVGNMDIASNNAATDKSAGRFRARKTAAGAWTLYRLS